MLKTLDTKKSKNSIAYIYLIITLSAWGSLYVVSKYTLARVPTFTLLFLRYLVSCVILFSIIKRRHTSRIEKSDYIYIFLIGFIGYFVSIASQFLGTKFASASIASLINSTNPIFIMLFAIFLLNEKFTLNKLICTILALSGTVIIIGCDSISTDNILGILFSFGSVISWSFMSVIVRKISQKYDSIQITTYALFIALIFSFPCSVYEVATNMPIELNLKVIMSVIYIGMICTALSHVLWNKSLSMLEASRCSLFYPIQPMVSVFLGWLLLGENINFTFILGVILILLGIFLSVFSKR